MKLQERLEGSKAALHEAKHQNHLLMERIQILQSDLNDSENRKTELEGLNRQSNILLVQRQEGEQELNQKCQKVFLEFDFSKV